MFQVRAEYTRRISFASRLFPKLKSSIGLDTRKLKSSDLFDGEVFCGGRSKNKDLLTFFGLINYPNSHSTYVQLPLFRRSLKKLTNLVEQELETIGAQEVLLPTLVPEKLWHDSKRLERQKDALEYVYRLTDKADNKLLLGPTFEESITRLVASTESIEESQLPLLLYQTSPKFRHEPNPRFGVLRSTEFFMNDLYSFDANIERATQTYETVSNIYENIFRKLGFKCLKIESRTGSIGGKYSHEYQVIVSSGEDTIVTCDSCEKAYNLEMYYERLVNPNDNTCLNCGKPNTSRTQSLELGHTFLLSSIYSKPLKAKYTTTDSNRRENFEMGCYGLGLTRILGAGLDLLSIIPNTTEDFLQMRWPNKVEPYKVGIIGPAKRSKQYHGGSSDFIEQIATKILDSTRNVDLLIEDRDKDGIGRRLFKLKSLGLPYIIIVGERFLQEQVEVELLELGADKRSYEQHWFTEDQLFDYIQRIDT